jgi:hypothetical protein
MMALPADTWVIPLLRAVAATGGSMLIKVDREPTDGVNPTRRVILTFARSLAT